MLDHLRTEDVIVAENREQNVHLIMGNKEFSSFTIIL